jgi:hypothetical protein
MTMTKRFGAKPSIYQKKTELFSWRRPNLHVSNFMYFYLSWWPNWPWPGHAISSCIGLLQPFNGLIRISSWTKLKPLYVRYSSVSDPDPDWIRIGSGFHQVSWSGSRRPKMTHRNKKKLRNFMFWFEVLIVLFWGLIAFSVAWTSFMDAYRDK